MSTISADKLHLIKLPLKDRVLEKTTLLPYFNRAGVVKACLLVDHLDRKCFMLYVDGHWPSINQQNPSQMTVNAPLWDITPLTNKEAEKVAGLWHFDPSRLLSFKPYLDRSWSPVIRATNCTGLFKDPPLDNLAYDLKLSKVVSGSHSESGGKGLPYDPKWLPAHGPRGKSH